MENRSNNISNNIYLELKHKILNFELKPGETISELELSKKYNVSRTPIKTVFTKLQNDNLILIKKNVGTYITKMSPEKIKTLLEFRELVERSVVIDNIEKFDEVLFLELELIVAKQRKLVSTQSDINSKLQLEFLNLDNEFHKVIFKYCDKENLWDLLEVYQADYARYRFLASASTEGAIAKKIEEHAKLLKFIKNQDLDKLKEKYNKHISMSGENDIEYFITKFPGYFE